MGHISLVLKYFSIMFSFEILIRYRNVSYSGAAKVDFSPESCILLRKHETLHKCSLVPIDH